ncbi:MAG: dTMP kinase [Planctomycetota bacterium]|jgi:dTMP kinase
MTATDLTTLATKLAGKFIVLDGPDGAGKSTQLALLADVLEAGGLMVRRLRDPGGTEIGDRVREILLDRAHETMNVECELMLYMASRAQLAHELIRPALAAGQCVLCDRFISSTIAYQGAGGADVDTIRRIGQAAVGETWPNLTIILDLDAEAGLSRVGDAPDRVEAKGAEFHSKVRDMFLRQAADEPGRVVVVDGGGTIEQTHQRIVEAVAIWAAG